MERLTRNHLAKLTERTDENSISIYMPAEVGTQGFEKNRIRFKNLVSDARKQLKKRNLSDSDIDEILKPIEELMRESTFWRNLGNGMALFRSPQYMESLELSRDVNELSVVSDRFHVKPLVHELNREGSFALLTLKLGEVQLYEGDRNSLTAVPETNMPASLADVLKYDEFRKQTQFHTGAPNRPESGRDAMFFGSGDADYDKVKAVKTYFRAVDKGLSEAINDRNIPLVLAGLDHLLPLYREVSGYKNIAEEQVSGDPKQLNEETLHERAWKALEPIFESDKLNRTAKYKRLKAQGSSEASSDLDKIVPAAVHGRIDTLFLELGVQRWGRYDPDNMSAIEHDSPETGDIDLLDFAAARTLASGGTVYVVKQDELPDGDSAAAIMRY